MSGSASLFDTTVGIVAVVAAILAALALIGVFFLLVRQQRLLRTYHRFMSGASGDSLEAVLQEHIATIHDTGQRVAAVEQLTRRLEKSGYFSFQHLGVVRYNPFQDTGSDQSFAVALVDGHGNGVVLSSLHARDVTRVYAKPLSKWESTYQLTDEEKQAIALAYQKK
ncbi:MAG: DUF4446 family protein [Anaerolineae bacterium]|nr:DUF4446 family protein [Anaerolineae bacterium]